MALINNIFKILYYRFY